MSLRHDERGLALAIVKFVMVIAIAAFLFTLLGAGADEIFTATLDQADTSATTDQINNAQNMWGVILFAALGIAMMYLVMRAVVEQRIGGPP